MVRPASARPCATAHQQAEAKSNYHGLAFLFVFLNGCAYNMHGDTHGRSRGSSGTHGVYMYGVQGIYVWRAGYFCRQVRVYYVGKYGV